MVEKILQLAAHITYKNHIPRAPNCSVPPISLSILQSPRPQIHSVAIAAHRVHISRSVVHRRWRIKLVCFFYFPRLLGCESGSPNFGRCSSSCICAARRRRMGPRAEAMGWEATSPCASPSREPVLAAECMIPSIRPSLSQRPSRICAPCSCPLFFFTGYRIILVLSRVVFKSMLESWRRMSFPSDQCMQGGF
ncbi:uncharacterized protein LOC120652064 [Panicum virgatum]|uniref:uncharacterized protein LOC120652064 n=1 Tax=Panicum virgatum TaxID=38727 RepID=UPI0019D5A50D|nr:uncharacterized protein LOC120652064 [Panicum virgatum]